MSGVWGQNACIHSSTIAAWSPSNEMRIGRLRSPSLAAGKLIGGRGMLGGCRPEMNVSFLPGRLAFLKGSQQVSRYR